MSKFEEKTIRTRKIYEGKIIDLQVDDVLLPDGQTSEREIIKHIGAVAVIAITTDHKILFVEQYRKPLERTLVEIPAGRIEPNEAPEMTAVRELEEETGYTTNQLDYVTSFYTTPGFTNELIHLYLTTDLIKLSEAVPGDDDEYVEVIELTLEEAQDYVVQQRIHDAKTNYAVLYLQAAEVI